MVTITKNDKVSDLEQCLEKMVTYKSNHINEAYEGLVIKQDGIYTFFK